MSLEPGSRSLPAAARLALGLLLSVGALNLIGQAARLLSGWPVIREWPRPAEQFRLQLGEVPYDLLRAADAILAPDAVTLLVTTGRDVRRLEYTTFHRALYFLSPRPVWWLSPAPPDGTWESRWWISAPVTAESILSVAAEKGASCILVSDPALEVSVGDRAASWQQGYLLELGQSGQCLRGFSETGGVNEFASPLWPLQVAAALAAICLMGHAMLAAIYSRRAGPSGIERAAQTWVVGAGAVSLLMLYLNAAGMSLEQQKIVLSSLALVWGGMALARRAKRRRPLPTSHNLGPPKRAPAPRIALLWALTLLLVIQFGLVIVSALGRPLYVWDSWVNWGAKARTIFLEGHISPAVYADPSRLVTLPDYPLGVPLLEAWLYGWLGAPDDRFAGLITVLYYAALGGVVYGALLRRGAGRAYALATTAAVLTLPHLAGLAGLVFPDLVLAACATLAGVSLLDWMETGSRPPLLLAAVAGGLMAWTKREGWVLLAALFVSLALLGKGARRAWIAAGCLALGGFLLAGPWAVFAAHAGLSTEVFLPTTLGTLVTNLPRLPVVGWRYLQIALSPDWNFLWPVLTVTLALRLAAKRRMRNRGSPHSASPAWFLPAVSVLYLAAMGLAFVFSAYVPYQQHMLTSAPRLVAQVAPVVVLWLALQGIRPQAAPPAWPC